MRGFGARGRRIAEGSDRGVGVGVDVDGVEDQLIGAASTVCRSENSDIGQVTVTAVAGQLVEQQRTELNAEDAVALIENEARAAYC